MKKITYLLTLLLTFAIFHPGFSQKIKACDITTVEAINKLLAANLTYDANSSINKGGYECRYTDGKTAGRYAAINALNSKIEFGNDMLKTDFETNKKAIDGGKKATGIYTKFYAYTKGGATAYYMTAEKNDYSAESFIFHFRKGNYVVTFSAENIPLKELMTKTDAIYELFKDVK